MSQSVKNSAATIDAPPRKQIRRSRASRRAPCRVAEAHRSDTFQWHASGAAESRTFPKITAQLFFRTGNASVALTSPGLAEMTAKVVRTGTASRPSRRIEEDLRRMGARPGHYGRRRQQRDLHFGARRNFQTACSNSSLISRVTPRFPLTNSSASAARKSKGCALNVLRRAFLASERLRRVLFGKHPYAIISPTEKQVGVYEPVQLKDFYTKAYSPSNALLLVVGDFAGEEMLALSRKAFGIGTRRHRRHSKEMRRRVMLAVTSTSFTSPAQCRHKSCLAIWPSRAAIQIGSACFLPTPSTAALSILAW